LHCRKATVQVNSKNAMPNITTTRREGIFVRVSHWAAEWTGSSTAFHIHYGKLVELAKADISLLESQSVDEAKERHNLKKTD